MLSFIRLLLICLIVFVNLIKELKVIVCDTNAFASNGNVFHYDLGVARITRNGKTASNIIVPTNDDYNTRINEDHENKRESSEKPEVEFEAENSGCDFGGKRLKIAASPQPPLVNCFQDFYGDWTCNGSNVEVIQLLSKQMNFKFDWLVLANNNLEQPKQVVNDDIGAVINRRNQLIAEEKTTITTRGFNYSGVIGLVSSGRALMAANGIINTIDRQKNNLLLSKPFDSFKLHFLLSKSVRDHDHVFIKPFSSTAWLAILLSSIFITIVFYVINSTSFHYILLEDDFLSKQVPLLKSLYYYLTRIIFRHGRHAKKTKNKNFLNNLIVLLSNKSSRIIRALIFKRNNNDDDNNRRLSNETTTSTLNESIVLFDREVDRMISSNGMLDFDTRVVSSRLEERRRHKELCKRWFYERKRARKMSKLKHNSGFFKLSYIVWYVAGSLANQGGETEDLPHASSTRILVAFWWLYLIVICSIHSGILTAILTFPKQLDFIQTLDDYLNLDESEKVSLKLTVDKNSEIANLLSNPDNLHKSPLQQLLTTTYNNNDDFGHDYFYSTSSDKSFEYKQPIVEVDFNRHRQRLLDDVQLGQAAYLEEKSTINLIITQEYFEHKPPKCQFKSSRYPIDIIPMSLILNKNEFLYSNKSSTKNCLKLINILLTRIMRLGLAQKWRRKYEAQGNDCLNTVIINAGDVSKIEVRHVVLAFWLLASGLLLGALSLIIEVVWLFAVDIDDDDEIDNYDDDDDNYGHEYNNNHYSDNNKKNKGKTSTTISLKSSSSSGIFTSSSSSSSGSGNSSEDDSIESGLKLGHKVTTFKNRMAIRSLRDGGKNLSLKKALKGSNKRKRKLFQFQRVTPLAPSLLFLQQQQLQLKRPLTFISELYDANDDDMNSSSNQVNNNNSDGNQNVVISSDCLPLNSLLLTNSNEGKQKDHISEIEELSKAIKLDKKRKKAAKLSEKRARRVKRTLNMVKRINEGKIYSDSKLLLNKVSHKARRASQAIVDHFGGTQQQLKRRIGAKQTLFFNANNNEKLNKGLDRVHFEIQARKKSKIVTLQDLKAPNQKRFPNRVGIVEQVKIIEDHL